MFICLTQEEFVLYGFLNGQVQSWDFKAQRDGVDAITVDLGANYIHGAGFTSPDMRESQPVFQLLPQS